MKSLMYVRKKYVGKREKITTIVSKLTEMLELQYPIVSQPNGSSIYITSQNESELEINYVFENQNEKSIEITSINWRTL